MAIYAWNEMGRQGSMRENSKGNIGRRRKRTRLAVVNTPPVKPRGGSQEIGEVAYCGAMLLQILPSGQNRTCGPRVDSVIAGVTEGV